MKRLRLAFTVAAFTFAVAVSADEVKLSNVHLCCNACVKGAEKAAAKAAGATVTVDKDAGTVAKWQTLISNAQATPTPSISITGATVPEGATRLLADRSGTAMIGS